MQVINEFNEKTKLSNNERIKNEFENKIKSSLEWVKKLKLQDWENVFKKIENLSKLEKDKKNMSEMASDIIKCINDPSDFEAQLKMILNDQQKKFNELSNQKYPKDLKMDLVVIINKTLDLQRGKGSVFELATTFELKHLEGFSKTEVDWVKSKDKIKLQYKLLNGGKKFINLISFNKINVPTFDTNDINLIFDILDFDIEPELKRILMNVLFPSETHITEALKHLEIKFFSSNGLIKRNVYFYNYSIVLNDLLSIVFSHIYSIIEANIVSQKEKDEKEFRNTIKNFEEEARADFQSKNNSNLQGLNFGKKVIENLYKFGFEKKLLQSSVELKDKIYNFLKSPNDLINLAYRESIETEKYVNAYKYFIHMNRFCLEIAQSTTQAYNDSKIDENIRELTAAYTKILESLHIFTLEKKSKNVVEHKSTHDIINDLKNSLSNNNPFFCDIFEKLKTEISLSDINNIDIFLNGFGQSINS